MNISIKEHIIKALDENIRFDGRKADEFRKVTIERNVIKNAEGSARVFFGDTQVIAGIKLGLEKPYPDTPDTGNLMVNVELLPLSNPEYESGPPSEEAIEVARIVDRGIRESKAIDTKKLCITPKEFVWGVMADIVTINVAGNIIDASSLAGVAALTEVKFPTVVDGAVQYDKPTKNKLPLDVNKLPITVTVYKIGKHLIVDPLTEEEEAADARLSVAVLGNGNLVALQKGGDEAITIEEVDAMIGLAQAKAAELRKLAIA